MKLQIIIGSTRPGRQTDRLAKWVANEAVHVEDTTVEIVDLVDYPMPLFNEPISPRFNPDRKPDEIVKKWLDKVDEADGYIIVTPEYNHSIPGVLKNALDYTDWQFVKKPIAIVSHGTVGGARAAEHLKGIISEIRAVVIPTAVAFMARVSNGIDETGQLEKALAEQPNSPQVTLKAVLAELTWYAEALATARAKA